MAADSEAVSVLAVLVEVAGDGADRLSGHWAVGVGLGLAGAYADWGPGWDGPGWGGDPCVGWRQVWTDLGLAHGASERLLVIGLQ
jgi:hypothetical protein